MTDHFSVVAKQYAEARPTYPPTLFDWLAGEASARDQVWDAGAGSWVWPAGRFELQVGRSARDLRLTAAVQSG